jgi:hypothetical protein
MVGERGISDRGTRHGFVMASKEFGTFFGALFGGWFYAVEPHLPMAAACAMVFFAPLLLRGGSNTTTHE